MEDLTNRINENNELSKINKLGLIALEMQHPDDLYEIYINGSILSKRAYINGLYLRCNVAKLVKKLYRLNPNIVVSETVLNTNESKDHINLFNYTETEVPLINGLFPMNNLSYGNKIIEWYTGGSGNVSYPVSRKYIENHLIQKSNELINEIISSYSLIQIWSCKMNDDILSTTIMALSNG